MKRCIAISGNTPKNQFVMQSLLVAELVEATFVFTFFCLDAKEAKDQG
jgi:hypothetical protein